MQPGRFPEELPMVRVRMASAVALTAALALSSPVSTQQLGTITFPTSGAAAAQEAFLTGVKALHSFQFDEAALAFQQAEKADPNFAMAYWGEAMSHNHPLWAQQDVEKAKAALDKLAPTHEARLAKAKLPKEKAFLEAQQILYFGAGDKLARDQAYSAALRQMYEQWADDHEVATWYALSLLGTVRPGDAGFRRQALAASIAEHVYAANPKHPGAAHFIIHAFDDPDHAPLALDAANAYAKIAPAAAHALHMPSHIYVQLGMWNDVAVSNIAAYKAAVDVNTRLKLAEGREDFHTLGWLGYANLMMGKFDEAKANVESAKAAADRNPNARNIRDGYLGMRARYIQETARWEKLELPPAAAPAAGGDHANMPGMNMPGMAASEGSATWVYIVGVSAAKLNDLATADAALAQLKSIREAAQGGKNAYAVRPHSIREKELGAIVAAARGQKDAAIALAKEAADVEATMAAPSGPPEPIKPAFELYGELLAAAGRDKEAASAFEQALLRTPNRTPSVKGLAAITAKARQSSNAGR
jgi:tetratricopeptide (TPR) repeat protein